MEEALNNIYQIIGLINFCFNCTQCIKKHQLTAKSLLVKEEGKSLDSKYKR